MGVQPRHPAGHESFRWVGEVEKVGKIGEGRLRDAEGSLAYMCRLRCGEGTQQNTRFSEYLQDNQFVSGCSWYRSLVAHLLTSEKLGERLFEARQAAGLGMRKLSQLAHVGEATINDIEKGRHGASTDTVERLAIARSQAGMVGVWRWGSRSHGLGSGSSATGKALFSSKSWWMNTNFVCLLRA